MTIAESLGELGGWFAPKEPGRWPSYEERLENGDCDDMGEPPEEVQDGNV